MREQAIGLAGLWSMADEADINEITDSEEEEEEELNAYLEHLNAATPYPASGALGSYQSSVPVELSPVGDLSVLPPGSKG